MTLRAQLRELALLARLSGARLSQQQALRDIANARARYAASIEAEADARAGLRQIEHERVRIVAAELAAKPQAPLYIIRRKDAA